MIINDILSNQFTIFPNIIFNRKNLTLLSSEEDNYDPINKIIGNTSFYETYGRNPTDYDDEKLRIKTHLIFVLNLLREKYRNKEKSKTNKVLDYLDEYIQLEQFPTNLELNYRNPIFIDKEGNYCAVGYLIMKTLGKETCKLIDEKYHFNYISEINNEILINWLEDYGLEKVDAEMIQPGYTPSAISMLIFIYLLAIMVPLFILNNLIFNIYLKFHENIVSTTIDWIFYLCIINFFQTIFHFVGIYSRCFNISEKVFKLNLLLGFFVYVSLNIIVFYNFSYLKSLNSLYMNLNCLIIILYLIISIIFSIVEAIKSSNNPNRYYRGKHSIELDDSIVDNEKNNDQNKSKEKNFGTIKDKQDEHKDI